MEYYINIIIKLIVTIILLIIYVKISGKSQMAPMSPFDQIGNIVVGALGGSTLLSPDISALNSSIFLVIWLIILLGIRYLRGRSMRLKEFIDGKRLILMENGIIYTDNFEEAHVTIADIETQLHADGIISLKDIRNIWLETNGEVTYDKKGDMNMSLLLIEEGKINEGNLELIHKDKAWLMDQLEKESISSISEVFCAEWIKDEIRIYRYNKSENVAVTTSR